jgi:hypothetical protein
MNAVNTSRRRRASPGVWRTSLLLGAVALSALAGCESDYGAKQGDPFVGIHGQPIPAAPTPAASGGSTGGTQTAGGGVPPIPGTHSLNSQAALAGGTLPAPENPRSDLRMDVTPIVPTGSTGSAARGAAPSNVQVGGPEPVPETTSRLTPIANAGGGGAPQPGGAVTTGAPMPAAPVPLARSASSMTFEEAQQYLKQRGVIWQRLETWGDQGQWKFRCSVPLPGTTGLNRTYETESPGAADPLTAMRTVIDKIEKDQH